MSNNMSGTQKLLFISSFLWTLHWGTKVVSVIVDTVILNAGVRALPTGF